MPHRQHGEVIHRNAALGPLETPRAENPREVLHAVRRTG